MMTLLPLLLTLSHPAQAAVVKGATWTSSAVSTVDGITVAEANLSDSKQGTPWVGPKLVDGSSAFVKADFGGEKTINSVTVWGGCWYNNAYWGHYARPKEVVLEFSDGSTQDVTLKDEFKPQQIPLTAPKKTTSVKFKIKSTYAGDAFQDVSISEVVFRDASPADRAVVTASKASTTLAPDGDAYYDTGNAADGIIDSMWCEGSKGDGTNEWLELTFDASVPVSKMKIRNGVSYSAELFKKSNRAATATLTFSDGSTETIKLGDMPFEQTITLAASHTTSKVKITFSTVTKGSEFNDMCVSDVYFVP